MMRRNYVSDIYLLSTYRKHTKDLSGARVAKSILGPGVYWVHFGSKHMLLQAFFDDGGVIV